MRQSCLSGLSGLSHLSRLYHFLLRPVVFFPLLLVGTTAVTLLSVILTDTLHLQPCPLCIFQRLLYLVIAAVSFLGCFSLIHFGALFKKLLSLVAASLIAILAAIGLGTAVYQSWLQLHPDDSSACNSMDPNLIEQLVNWLGERSEWFLATGFCSSKEWVFLDLSIANWSVLLFLAVLLLSVAYLLNHRRQFAGIQI